MAGIDPNTADKDQLIDFAKTEYKVVIDPRTKIETIRTRVQGLIDGISPAVIASDAEVRIPNADTKYVKNTNNGRVFEYQAFLVGENFVPCDVDGNVV